MRNGTPRRQQVGDGRVERVQIGRRVGDGDDLGPESLVPVAGMVAVRAVDAQDQFGPGRERRRPLRPGRSCRPRREALVAQHPDRVADAGPRPAGVAAEVDHVGPAVAIAAGLGADRVEREGRGVVDLGEDLDVVLAVALGPAAAGAEVLGQVAQVFRALST